MKNITHPDCIAGNTASRTNSGHEIVIDWPEHLNIPYVDKHAAKQSLVNDGIAEWRKVPNGFSGFDFALYKL